MFMAMITILVASSGGAAFRLLICRSSACQIWILECYKHHAPLALKAENLDSKIPMIFNLHTPRLNSSHLLTVEIQVFDGRKAV
jgi:hypothetical protein